MNILIPNLGSTSLKYQILEMPSERVLGKGRLERVQDYREALGEITLADATIDAVAFKAVHGGSLRGGPGLGDERGSDRGPARVRGPGCRTAGMVVAPASKERHQPEDGKGGAMTAARPVGSTGPDIATSALIVVDMQNDFVSEGGYFDRVAKKHPASAVDREFLASVIPQIRKLVEGFRAAGRPVVYIKHVLESDYADACFPYWRLPPDLDPVEAGFIVDGTWGCEIVDELKPATGEKVVVKKGFNGFHRTPLEAILRNLGVTTCVMTGVTTCVCVSSTTRGGVERNFRMVFVSDGTAEVHRAWHEAELATMNWVYADVVTSDQVLEMLRTPDRPPS